jgi:hypothetical protein
LLGAGGSQYFGHLAQRRSRGRHIVYNENVATLEAAATYFIGILYLLRSLSLVGTCLLGLALSYE